MSERLGMITPLGTSEGSPQLADYCYIKYKVYINTLGDFKFRSEIFVSEE
jgi:hypothetical protein